MASPTTVLVITSTGKQGSEVCRALKERVPDYAIFGTTRSVPAPKLAAKGITPVAFDFSDPASVKRALEESRASLVWFTTDFFGAAGGKFDREVAHGRTVIDACKASPYVRHVVYSSAIGAEDAPDAVEHLKSKLVIEHYLAASGLAYTVVRPPAFYENFDAPEQYNPLKKGYVSMLWDSEPRVPYVATRDIGRASAAILANPAPYTGRVIDLVGAYATGAEVAAALSVASGVHCRWTLGVPKLVQRLLMADLCAMSRFFEAGVKVDAAAFRELVPQPVSLLEYFASRGKWSNGEAFKPLPGGAAPPVPPPSSLGWPVLLLGAAVVAAVAVYAAPFARERLRLLQRRA